MDATEALKLAALGLRGCELNLSNPYSRWRLCGDLQNWLARITPQWKLAWGPIGYRPGPVGLDIAAMYAASSDASNLAIVIRGTNLFSVVDWISNLPTAPKQWEYGGAGPEVTTTLSTWLGLRLLQRLQCGPIPSGDPGESLAQILQAAAAKLQGATVYAFIKSLIQGSASIDVGAVLPIIIKHIRALSDGTSNPGHDLLLRHAFDDAAAPMPSSGTALEFLTQFIAAAVSPANVYVIGHSKGGPLAAAYAQWLFDIKQQWDPRGVAKLQVYSFAGPTPGNDKFAARYAASHIPEERYENTYDIVPHVWDPTEMRQVSGLYGTQLTSLTNVLDDWAASLAQYRYQHEVTAQSRAWQDNPQQNFLKRLAIEHLDGYLKAFGLYAPNSFDTVSIFAPI